MTEPREPISFEVDEYGYLIRKKAPNGREIGVMPFLWTWAIIADITETGYEERWCYHELGDALYAFETWDGEGEPTGWHRHPTSGRRVDKDGNLYIAR